MSPRRWRKKLQLGNHRPGRFLVEDQAGFSYTVCRRRAAELILKRVVRPVSCRGGVKLQELPKVRAIYSTRYLQDRFSRGLRLYRDDLIKTVEQSRTGKPATAQRSTNAKD